MGTDTKENPMRSSGLLLAITAIAGMPVAGCTRNEPPIMMGEESVVFTGVVEKLEILGQREATVFPVGVDPRYLMVVKVDSVEQNRSSPVAHNKSINFAIHSPSRLLGIDDPVGKEFRFRATWKFVPEDKRFMWIEARPAPR